MKVRLTKGKLSTACYVPSRGVVAQGAYLTVLMTMLRLGWTITGEEK